MESFNSRLRDELLDREMFTSYLEANVLLEQYRREHNEERPHSSLGYRTPEQFTAMVMEKTGGASAREPGQGQARFARRSATLDRARAPMQEAATPGRRNLPGSIQTGLS